ncbi:hypothetical protein KKC45_03805 [Patescibacteria group bacterium]|nr:hypothetical protein [Patescibacteria group bacterium]
MSLNSLIVLNLTNKKIESYENIPLYRINDSVKSQKSKNITDRFLKEPTNAIKYNSEIPDWKTYYNDEFGFRIEIPADWYVYERDSHISFGTIEAMIGGGRWGISIYTKLDDVDKQINDILSEVGDQFEDRVVKLEDINDYTKKSTVTTAEVSWWVSEIYFIISEKYIYTLNNGARQDDGFENFIGSFKFKEI